MTVETCYASSANHHINKPLIKTHQASDEVLKFSLGKFFHKKENIERFLPFLNKSSPISLRLLDYFCVNYAKEYETKIIIEGKVLDIYASYRHQLATYSKKKFDPFKRNERIPLSYNGKKYYTTYAQLSFFKWCLTYNIIEYVEHHKNEILEDMKITIGNRSSSASWKSGETTSTKRSSKKSSIIYAIRVPGEDTVLMKFD
jgi:hypothetical protein